jgi:putative colanic acid biosysnthesis UDP-glucose lipid carrier transferase
MFTKFLLKEHTTLLSFIIKVVYLLLYLSAAILLYYWQFNTFKINFLYEVAIIISLLLFNPILSLTGVYRSLRGRSLLNYLQPLVLGIFVLILLLALTAFITKTGEYYSRQWFLLWHLCAIILLVSCRIVVRKVLNVVRKHGLDQRQIVIIGEGTPLVSLIEKIKKAEETGFNIAGVFTNTPLTEMTNTTDIDIEKIPNDITAFIDTENISEVWLTWSTWSKEQINQLLKSIHNSIVTIRYFPCIFGIELINQSISEILSLPVINIIASPMTGGNRIIKAIEDRVLSFIIILLISPVLLIIAGLVKISSPGPVFFKQERVGMNGKVFEMLKFRSMPVDAEMKTGAVWTTPSDRRATRIGGFLRKTSLDELPQFFNVIKGEMSIVGPRPERPMFVEKFKSEIPSYMQKHLVKAGITGWAQVNGWRGSTSLEKRVEYDLYYINHWSLGFDLKIIFLTIFKGFVNENAY